jgi:UDP-N-acetylmuramoyl-L-alanyl-D-glutamate--2,6-diaminopimelate ligase
VPRPTSVVPTTLDALRGAAGAGAELRGGDVPVTGVTMASTAARPGDLFAAAPGGHAHGAAYADQAVRAGAAAVLTDAAGTQVLPDGLPTLVVPDVRAAVGPVAAAVYGSPSSKLSIIGITGTSGKTTTTFFVRAGLLAAGRRCGLMGTVATMIGDESIKTGFTTPEAPDVQALLAVMCERGMDSVAMEVSSHALALGRAGGIEFAIGAFTNLSQDHLDFHPDMADYFGAKARLFDGRSRAAVVCVDDEWGRRMAALAGTDTITVSTTGPADWTVSDVHTDASGHTTFRAHGPRGDLAAGCAVPGAFNVTNAVLALAILDRAGVDPVVAAEAVAQAVVPGRMERVDAGQQFLAVVDYSHKPAAVEGALAALRPLTAKRLIIVLGCGGDRDRAKRPLMGEIAARNADLLLVTDDNPRSEDPAAIRAAMLAGASAVPAGERGEIREIGDRAAAIAAAVAAAQPGDTVLVAGKGHEPGQEIAGVTHDFDDRVVLRAALEQLS